MNSLYTIGAVLLLLTIILNLSGCRRHIKEGLDNPSESACCDRWVQTLHCKGDGYIDDGTDYKKDHTGKGFCTTSINTGSSGYCLCKDGTKQSMVDCGHEPFVCEDVCKAHCTPPAPKKKPKPVPAPPAKKKKPKPAPAPAPPAPAPGPLPPKKKTTVTPTPRHTVVPAPTPTATSIAISAAPARLPPPKHVVSKMISAMPRRTPERNPAELRTMVLTAAADWHQEYDPSYH